MCIVHSHSLYVCYQHVNIINHVAEALFVFYLGGVHKQENPQIHINKDVDKKCYENCLLGKCEGFIY